jgi:hypothetical protein
VGLLAVFACGCGSETPKKTEAPIAVADAAKPADESHRFPKPDLVDTQVVETNLMGKSFMPGGSLARYKTGTTEYEMFLAGMPSAEAAAILLPDWNRALTDSKLVPSFGGYFGKDGGRPVFVFTKDRWIAGVVGLDEQAADTEARKLAAELR